jgi:N-sulfoglucosamine sulfohydrolase
MHRLQLAVWLTWCCIAWHQVSFCQEVAPVQRQPNIVLLVADDLGANFASYGNASLPMPQLDGLASQGVRFRHAFCTTASCSPSRSVILSGLYSHSTGQYGLEHSYHHQQSFATLKTLPVRLSEGGYETVRIGKYHVAPESTYRFDHFLRGDARNPVAMANEVGKFIKDKKEKPWFLYFCTVDPHRSGAEKPNENLAPDPFGNRPQGYPGVKPFRVSPQDVQVPAFLPDNDVTRAELVEYYESCRRFDEGIGQLRKVLEREGVADNTIIMVTSDNGIAFPGAKTTLYDPGMQVPLIVYDPRDKRFDRDPQRTATDLPQGVVHPAMISHVDLTPTILELAQVEYKATDFQGRSFAKILFSPDEKNWGEEKWNKVYGAHNLHEITMYYPMRAVRSERYKLIWNIAHQLPFPFASDLWAASTWQAIYRQGEDAKYGFRSVSQYVQRPQFELYDLQKDPDERVNLASDAEYAGLLEEMKNELKEFQSRTKDPWILKWNRE